MGDLTGRARELREAAGVSQARMAAHAGVSQSTLAAWEEGRVACPGLAKPEAARRWRAALRFLETTEGQGAAGRGRVLNHGRRGDGQ